MLDRLVELLRPGGVLVTDNVTLGRRRRAGVREDAPARCR